MSSSIKSSSTHRRRRTARRVSFGGLVVHPALERHSLDEEQIASMWYNSEERNLIRKQARKVLRKYQKQGVIDAKNLADLCHTDLHPYSEMRGLECQVASSRSIRLETSIRPILKLQQEHKKMGLNDPKGLQVYASCLNRPSVEIAIQTGAHDYQEAFQIYLEAIHAISQATKPCESCGTETTSIYHPPMPHGWDDTHEPHLHCAAKSA